jgi:hypothetical protein
MLVVLPTRDTRSWRLTKASRPPVTSAPIPIRSSSRGHYKDFAIYDRGGYMPSTSMGLRVEGLERLSAAPGAVARTRRRLRKQRGGVGWRRGLRSPRGGRLAGVAAPHRLVQARRTGRAGGLANRPDARSSTRSTASSSGAHRGASAADQPNWAVVTSSSDRRRDR